MTTVLDEATTAMLRRVLDDVLSDSRFITQTSVSAFQVAEHIWRQTLMGERDFDRIKQSALARVQYRAGTSDPGASRQPMDHNRRQV
jgi:hypothetical protein